MGTPNIKSYVVGNRKQRQYMVQASKELEMIAHDGRRAGSKLNLTHVIDGFHGNEHTLPDYAALQRRDPDVRQVGDRETPTLIVNYGGPFGEDTGLRTAKCMTT